METTNPVVSFSTNAGDFSAEIFVDKAPISAENFLSYVKEGFFDGLIFHRVIPRFMIQGGGFDKDMKQKKAKAPIKNEAGNGLKNLTGTLAMARTNVVDSATCQFFINVTDNEFLDHKNNSPDGYGYAVFGRISDGMDVVHKIEKVRTGNRGLHQDVPVEPVVINSVKLAS
ncbi:MAG TPA: peptidylprolyl isomerase [Verrucomicrobiae bacterium]|jgi:peptidyl-prolyl cis-trans isomerase B (cyclophilin B)|nr:peptidylprolyl isomerase [Verrucomicrobiae bacterium]